MYNIFRLYNLDKSSNSKFDLAEKIMDAVTNGSVQNFERIREDIDAKKARVKRY